MSVKEYTRDGSKSDKKRHHGLPGSSASVSVSPAPNCPGVVVILFGPFNDEPLTLSPNSRVRRFVLDLVVLTPEGCFELAPHEVYIMLSSSRSSPLSAGMCCDDKDVVWEGYMGR